MKKRIFLLTILSFFILSVYAFCLEKQMVTTCYTGPLPVPKKAKTISALEAYHMLLTQPNTYLIDVRTRAEYQLVGHPCYIKDGKIYQAYNFPVKIWKPKVGKGFKYMKVLNKDFVKEISKKFKKTDNLIIICRSGDRSVIACNLLTDAGFKHVYNVKYGFEGKTMAYGVPKNLKKIFKKYSYYFYVTKSRLNGWRYYGLCQSYKMDPQFMYPPDVE